MHQMTMNYYNCINRVSFYNFHAPIGVGKFANFVHTYYSINVRGWEMSKTFVMFVTVFQNQNFLKSWTDTVLCSSYICYASINICRQCLYYRSNNNQGCASFIGRQFNGKQEVTLQDPYCAQVYTISWNSSYITINL